MRSCLLLRIVALGAGAICLVSSLLSAQESGKPRQVPREVRDRLDKLAGEAASTFEQGKFQQELDAHRQWRELYLQHHDANDPAARLQQATLDSAARAVALHATQRADLLVARREYLRLRHEQFFSDFAKATERIARVTPTFKSLLGERDVYSLSAQWADDFIRVNQRQTKGVEDSLRTTITHYETLLGNEHPEIAAKRGDLAIFYALHERWEDAWIEMLRVAEIRAQHDLPRDGKWCEQQLTRGQIMLARDFDREALLLAQEIIAIASTNSDYRKYERLGYLLLGQCYVKKGRDRSAIEAFAHGFDKSASEGSLLTFDLHLRSLKCAAGAYRRLERAPEADFIEGKIGEVEKALAESMRAGTEPQPP